MADFEKTINKDNITINTTTYSGYLEVSDEKKLHYLFIQSVNDNTTSKISDPVLIWFNGGPGCSSLLGAFQENGPIIVDADGDRKFRLNEHSWNARANVLYLE
jgi:carboxypeptidase C (cathepsin A)